MTAIRGQPLVRDQVFLTGAGVSDHTLLSNIGVNTHPQIDTHIADTSIHGTAIADGTSTNNTLRWSGAAWVETNGITIDPAGAVQLRFNANLTLSTTNEGLDIFATTGVTRGQIQLFDISGTEGAIIKNDGGALDIVNREHGRLIRLLGENDSGVQNQMLTADPDDTVQLYYNNSIAFRTNVDGADVFDTTGNDPVIFFFQEDLTTRTGFIQLGAGANNMHIRSEVHGQEFNIEGEDIGGVLVQLVNCDPDGSVDLFFDASIAFSTQVGGITVISTIDNNPFVALVQDDGTTRGGFVQSHGVNGVLLQNEVHGTLLTLSAEDAGGTPRNLLVGDADGSVDLYFDGTRVVETTARGLDIFDDGTNGSPRIAFHDSVGLQLVELTWFSNDLFIDNETVGGEILLRVDNINTIHAKGGGSVDLYFNGTVSIETIANGMILTPVGANTCVLNLTPQNASGSAINFNETVSTKAQIFWIPGDNNFQFRTSDTGKNMLFTNVVDGDMMKLNAGSSVDLYFNAAIAAVTHDAGLSMYEASGSGGSTSLRFFNQNGVTQFGQVQMNNAVFGTVINTITDDEDFTVLGGSVAQGALTPMIVANPDSSVDLYFRGDLAFQTDLDGIVVRDPSGDLPRVSFEQDSGIENLFIEGHTSYFRIAGLVDGAFLWITAEDNAGVQRNLIIADPDSAFELFHTGTRVFTSIASGLTMFSPTGNDPIFNMTQDDGFNKNAFIEAHSVNGFRIENEVHGSLFTLAGEDTGGTPRNLFVADPDSDVKLYFAGTQEFATKSSGCIIANELEITGDLNHDGTNIGFYGTAPAAQSAAYTRNATIVEDRTLLASASATILNNNNVLAALIADLQSRGLIG